MNVDYSRSTLSFWLMKINPINAGTITITAPATKLSKKFDNEGVINPVASLLRLNLLLIVRGCYNP